MTENSQDELIRAYETLPALRKNIDQITKNEIEETFVNEFHNALDKLASSTGKDVSDFRIPNSELAPIITGPTSFILGAPGNTTTYSKEKYVNKQYFLMKIDSVLGYFEIITSEKPKRIGYNTHKD